MYCKVSAWIRCGLEERSLNECRGGGDVPGGSGRGPLTAVSWLDWKLGARMLLKYPALTIIGGLSLAGAIAIGAVGIEVANELLYKRLPFEEGGRVVRLETRDAAASRVEPRVLHDFAIWRRSLKTVAELGAARVSERNVLTGEGRVESLRVAEITASAFPLTRVSPPLGRALQPTDEMPGAEPVVVLGYDVWQRQFLRDPAIIGRVVTVGRTARTVVGVMPPRFGFPHNQQLWVPLPVQDAAPREGPAVQVFGRLADGASWQDAAAELDVVSARLAADEPTTHAQLRTRVRAFAGRTPGDPLRLEDLAVHAIVLLLLGAVSANVATLIFARTAMRESEIVVRHALGASRARVIAQIVTEALVLALAAAVLGLVVAQTTVRYAWARASLITGDDLPFWVDLTLEPATIAYALLLALVAAALIGLLPALKATGASVQRGLQGITSTGGTMKFGGIWSFIIGAQVACTLLFVPAAVGIFTNTLHDESRWAPFPAERYLTFRLSIDNEALAGEHGVPDDGQIGARRARAYEELAGRLREEPGVTHVTYGDRLPTMSPEWVALEMEQDGAPPARLQGNFEGGFAMAAVGAGYHDAFGAGIVAGRGLHAADAGAPNRPIVVNEAFMRVVGRNPVGARIRTLQRGSEREPGPWHEIVGVVTDLPGCSPPIGVGRRTSIAQPPRRRSILSWSPCASRGTRRRLRPASTPLPGRSMRACTSGISSPSTTSSNRSTHGWWVAASSSAAFCSWRWSSPRPACTRSWPSPCSVAPARSASVSHSAPTPGACSVPSSPVPAVSSAAASSPATASSCSSRGAPTA